MKSGALGRVYRSGEVIINEGDKADCMYVVQQGKVEVLSAAGGKEVRLSVLGDGEVFGEMAIIDRKVRSATVRALGDTRVLTIDKKNFLRRIHEDPSLALNLVENMSRRIRQLDKEVGKLKSKRLK